MLQLFTVDIRTNFFTVQFTNIKPTTRTPAENKTFVPLVFHSVKKLIAEYKLGGLIPFSFPSLADFALMNLAVVLSFRNYQQGVFQPFSLKILRYDEGIVDMGFYDALFLTPIFRNVPIGATNVYLREHIAKSS